MNETSSLKARFLSSCEVATVQQASLRSSRADDAAVVVQTGRAQCLRPSPKRAADSHSYLINGDKIESSATNYPLRFCLLPPRLRLSQPDPASPSLSSSARLTRIIFSYYYFVPCEFHFSPSPWVPVVLSAPPAPPELGLVFSWMIYQTAARCWMKGICSHLPSSARRL